MNKARAGYKMLMILSAVDNEFQEEEKTVIQHFIKKMWADEKYDEDEINAKLKTLTSEDWMPRFREYMDFFYKETNEKERNEFLQFAMDLVKADDVITEEENTFLKLLFDSWDPDNE